MTENVFNNAPLADILPHVVKHSIIIQYIHQQDLNQTMQVMIKHALEIKLKLEMNPN